MSDLTSIYLTKENEKWINVLESEDIFKLRKLLKKEKNSLPPSHRRLYLRSDNDLKEFMYTLILSAPGLTHLKSKARNYLRSKKLGISLMGETCKNCYWFLTAPLIDDNPELAKDEVKKSCKELGALSADLACEGFKNRGQE